MSPLGNLDCATDTAEYRRLGGHGLAQVFLGRPDPAKVPANIPLADWLEQDATAMVRIDCGPGTPPATTVGPVVEQRCTHSTTAPGFTAAIAVSNDRAAAAAILDLTGDTAPDTATRHYLVAQARTLAYAMLGSL
ncbi:hypothetical protein Raf01_90900 [Rugosimonospora africana]|uniref:Uncharacterized protein n=2 Tax=Rugosimonospora africana TaxID=556532 RepID=A0A8J3R3A9_9ACTN|nr:hypothetical protein Raf01_90900 [Rugosimonospora africana]